MINPAYQAIENDLPLSAGVYRYYDQADALIYVGKAKNLKRRVASYFVRTPDVARTRLMVSKIVRIEYTLVDTEMDALLLENNLIKKYQPRYNIRLKDDKTYPFICIKNEPVPRLIVTRNLQKDGSVYFGPYTSLRLMQTLLDLIKATYPLRTCALNLAPQHIAALKYSSCLEYQIGNCLAPCVGKQTAADYHQNIAQIAQILKGNTGTVLRELNANMQQAAADYQFEKAQNIKQKIEIIQSYQSKSTIVNPDLGNLDVFTIVHQAETAVVNYLQINNGAVVRSHNLTLKSQLDETTAELLLYAIIDIRTLFDSKCTEILTNEPIETPDSNLKFVMPKVGDKKRLIEISLKNSFFEMQQIIKQNTTKKPEERTDYVMTKMQKDLSLPNLPKRIDCFDNSNIQGEYPVSAMVCFVNGKPAKSQYRHFNVKTVVGPDDFATMEEVVYRRYKRVMDENPALLPQLIVIDGGKGQLSAAVKSLKKLELHDKIPILGIAKNLEELFFPNDPVPLHLDKKSITLRIIQQLRDEAHRFGITHHRNQRSKQTLTTQLTDIEGIGEIISKKLLTKYKSVNAIKALDFATLKTEIGEKRANALRTYFDESEKNV